MTRMLVIVAILVGLAGVFTRPASADPQKDGETVMGAVWHYVIKNGDVEKNGDFRVYKGDIFIGPKKIGNTKGMDEDDVMMIFGGYEDLNGRATLKKTKTRPATFRGKLLKKDNTEWDMLIVVRNR